MSWVRIHPYIVNWPGGGAPPVFEISSDENGSAVIELAWDPQALLAPASYSEPLRYYSTDVPFMATITTSSGTSRALNVPPQTITLASNRATWVMPADLWAGYLEESLKTLGGGPPTNFQSNIYYRVRLTHPGASNAVVWPTDAMIRGNLHAPRIGVLRLSATPASQILPDIEAANAMGGLPFLPTFWGDLLRAMWDVLPEADPHRQSLAAIFAHPNYQSQSVATRAKILRLWLVAGKNSRPRLPQLLSRSAVVGSGIVQPVLAKQDLRGGKMLVDNLLALLNITPHPDIVAFYSSGGVKYLTAYEQLLDDVITEILDPNGQINQGEAGTCSPTSIMTLLINVNPAEYARLMLGLLSKTGSATLARGGTISIPPAIYQLARYPLAAGSAFFVRTFSELGFQATVLKYAQDSRFPAYDPSANVNASNGLNTVFQRTISAGLFEGETKRGLDGLFNVNFTTHFIPQPTAGQSAAQWTAAFQAAQPALLEGLLRDLPGRQQQMILATFWGALPPSPNAGGHAVMAIRRDNGRVFFKNPQYAGSNPSGATGTPAAGPPRRYDDASATLESMVESDLRSWIMGYWVPDTALI
ncbi:MAG: hypothetical protein H7Z42_01100 [Roseiflexaceae bacterium]|nr:hypothetical protein [Roseiflexaceae bacterium]